MKSWSSEELEKLGARVKGLLGSRFTYMGLTVTDAVYGAFGPCLLLGCPRDLPKEQHCVTREQQEALVETLDADFSRALKSHESKFGAVTMVVAWGTEYAPSGEATYLGVQLFPDWGPRPGPPLRDLHEAVVHWYALQPVLRPEDLPEISWQGRPGVLVPSRVAKRKTPEAG